MDKIYFIFLSINWQLEKFRDNFVMGIIIEADARSKFGGDGV